MFDNITMLNKIITKTTHSKRKRRTTEVSCLRHVWLSEVFDKIIIVLRWFVLKEAVVDRVTLYCSWKVLSPTLQTTRRLGCHVAAFGRYKVYQYCRRLSVTLSTIAGRLHVSIVRILSRLQHSRSNWWTNRSCIAGNGTPSHCYGE